ncbi:adenosylcobalamin-dependent ribonucleoside-diphosphate reductase [archaeon]|jgi:ribonucleoside-diphosphate reductase alpha chain|nr:adenosylcobalamin-dependent ribonucleoside-diphosphate reductase [archaeon]MBT3451072.1 adenosylcobalamin-dependent ribonucleoside-diphosphate reductase [archaeon]MBT6869162.1 adenosylcobalamin-dependent ribonucleoside-diphosphate reductase [archaeon]MBT7192809.1 adenosylcobalamin-dependent ribonucleoside-diphosphate reductase [archaeon]MBT7381349.1 adenosylcobalamin-dependent ribonucleoside-diphosphate reductase [archaeon]
MPIKIKKRTGEVIDYDPGKITTAIYKAILSTGEKNENLASELAGLVQDYIFLMEEEAINVEIVQDLIEKILMEEGHSKVAKSFILYRQKRKELRDVKASSGVIDDCKLGINSFKIIETRYLNRDKTGKIIETPKGMFERVASHIALAEEQFGGDYEVVKEKFLNLMLNLEFLPNSPMLMNAGNINGQLSSVFCLPIKDSTESIFNALKDAAIIHQRGGGTGFSFSRIRPRADRVNNLLRVSSGPLAFLKIYDKALSEIKQGGRRAGANMAILRVDHPDILDFITCKESQEVITNFNLSIGLTNRFMEALQNEQNYDLINPRDNKPIGQLNAKRTLDLISTMAWKNGDPGIVFLDRMNNERSNPTPKLGIIETTSPCGEQPMLPYESVILGSINLSKHIIQGEEINRTEVYWDKLKGTVHSAVHFMDNAIEANNFHLTKTRNIVKGNRKFGLGIMGWADMLVKLKIPYNSQEALNYADTVMKFINDEARAASCDLAKKRGIFPNFEGSLYDNNNEYHRVRNATKTAISPTGTLSIIASCSPSIEPLFALSYLRKTSQYELLEVNPLFEKVAREEGFYDEDLMKNIAKAGSLQNVEGIPKHIKRIFLTSMDLSPEEHVRMQAAFQRHVDGAISKTVNIPYYSTVEDVKEIFLLAYKLGCKGITIYRDGSKDLQVLNSRF